MIINECPECESDVTSSETIQWDVDSVEVVYTCDYCDTVFVVTLGNPVKEVLEQ